jgi:non-ribosomal peptide synthetase component F
MIAAVGQDNVPMARPLLEYGTEFATCYQQGRPRYFFVGIHAPRSAEMVQLLLDHEADLQLQVST